MKDLRSLSYFRRIVEDIRWKKVSSGSWNGGKGRSLIDRWMSCWEEGIDSERGWWGKAIGDIVIGK